MTNDLLRTLILWVCGSFACLFFVSLVVVALLMWRRSRRGQSPLP